MTHRHAVFTMIAVTLMWSIAGVVTRHLEAARSFEVTFWRSAFTVVTLAVLLPALRGREALVRSLREGGTTLWLSGLCWSVMFTAFMVALIMTTVANVLVTMAISPLLTALVARFFLGHRLATRQLIAIRRCLKVVSLASPSSGWKLKDHCLQQTGHRNLIECCLMNSVG